jgi:hypothetical protein
MKIIKETNQALSGFPRSVIKDIEEKKITSEELFADMGIKPSLREVKRRAICHREE